MRSAVGDLDRLGRFIAWVIVVYPVLLFLGCFLFGVGGCL